LNHIRGCVIVKTDESGPVSRLGRKAPMKVKYTTSLETATVLKEWASNCGSALKGNHLPSHLVNSCLEGREKPVSDFMTGIVDVEKMTPEAVLSALGPQTRHIRPRTMAKLAKTLTVEAA
jgi:hypothetical protein